MKTLIWDNNLAYGVGLIATDGNLSPDRRHIEFSSKDLELIKNIKKSFKLKNKIDIKTRGSIPKIKYHRIQFGNIELYNALLDIGLIPKKSHKIEALKIPQIFLADFLRSVIDGDGSIGYFMHPESRKKQFRVRIVSASKNFLIWLRDKIKMSLGTKGAIRQCSRVYELCYYKQASVKLINFIYYKKDILLLRRKFKTAKLLKREGGGTGTRVSLRS